MVEVVNNVIGKKPNTSNKFAQIVQRKANKSRYAGNSFSWLKLASLEVAKQDAGGRSSANI